MNTPGAAPPQAAIVRTLPTLGSVVGSALGSMLAIRGKLDPLSAATLISGLTGLATAGFHWLGSKLGVTL